MRALAILLLAILTGCQTVAPQPDNAPLPAANTIAPLAMAPLEPLDLTAYKSLHFYVIKTPVNTYSCTTFDDVSNVDTLLFKLEDRIDQQNFIIVKYKNYYEPQLQSVPVDSTPKP